MRQAVQNFVTALLDHARTSMELEVMLNFNHEPSHEIWFPGQRQTLERLKLAIRYKQKTVRDAAHLSYAMYSICWSHSSLWHIQTFSNCSLPFGMRVCLAFGANKHPSSSLTSSSWAAASLSTAWSTSWHQTRKGPNSCASHSSSSSRTPAPTCSS